VQFEVEQNSNLKERLKKLDVLLQLLPETIEVQTRRPTGKKHTKQAVPGTEGKAAIELVNAAMDFTERVQDTDFKTAARYADHRDVMIEAIAEDEEDEE